MVELQGSEPTHAWINGEQQVGARRRRTRAEVRQLVSEFVNSGMRQSEFCRNRGLSISTLDRHLEKRRWKRTTRSSRRQVGASGIGHRQTTGGAELTPAAMAGFNGLVTTVGSRLA
jgi:hypothetical protein